MGNEPLEWCFGGRFARTLPQLPFPCLPSASQIYFCFFGVPPHRPSRAPGRWSAATSPWRGCWRSRDAREGHWRCCTWAPGPVFFFLGGVFFSSSFFLLVVLLFFLVLLLVLFFFSCFILLFFSFAFFSSSLCFLLFFF